MVLDTGQGSRRTLDELVRVAHRVGEAVESVIEGKADAVRLALTVLLAEGHVLIEDVPGVGKTMLAKALARSTDCSVRRIQFTPDLLPSDITGVSAYNQERREFEFKPGPVFANIVVGDEINRASPKTQSALLECMEERQVTVDGHDLPADPAVHGDRHAEPDRDGGHLPAARGAAGPVHRPDLDGLPERRVRTGDARRARVVLAAGQAGAGRRGRGHQRAHRRRARRCTWPSPEAVRHQAGLGDPHLTRSCGWAPRRGPHSTCCGPAGRGPPWTAATSSSPTTCRRWPCPCWPTGCCPAPRRWSTQQSPERVLAAIVDHVPLPQLR